VYYPSHDEWESPRRIADLRMRAGVARPLRELVKRGWLVFLITNQPSFAKGKCSLEDLQEVQRAVEASLRNDGVNITNAYVCYHHPQSIVEGYGACECRKPSPFFIQKAAVDYGIDLSRSWIAGDQGTDIEAGLSAGVRTALIEYERSQAKRGSVMPDLVCASVAEFVRKLGDPDDDS
jgi:D-glycero-D-manno-heptose 1,7-bisphosphate phosphatase